MKRYCLLLTALVGITVSCDSTETVFVRFDTKSFSEQKEAWISSCRENYQYRLFGMGHIGCNTTITVENGKYKQQIPYVEGDYVGSESDIYLTIDEVYNDIEAIYNEYNNTERSKKDEYLEEIIVEYDKQNHIPVKIDYRWFVPSGVEMDGTFYYEIKDFVAK
jgi:hypothetical protein